MMPYTIYHNPTCSKSRATLALLEQSGIRPRIVEYLADPPDSAMLLRIARLLGCRPAELIRGNDPDYRECAREIGTMDDEQAARWLAEHPAALQRPIVVRDQVAAVIGRPPENVLGIITE